MLAVVEVDQEARKVRATQNVIEGMNAMDAEEERRHQDTLAQWTQDWQAQEAHLAEHAHVAEVDKDVRHSGLLACGVAAQLTQQELAKAAKLEQSFISKLLRYYRFNCFSPVGLKIPEGRFRDYWRQVSDPSSTKGRRKPEVVNAYEAQVFPIIAELIAAGTPPVTAEKVASTPRLAVVKTATPQQKKQTRALRVEIQEIYGRIKVDIHDLKEMAGAERARVDPLWIALKVTRLEKGFMALQKALKRDVLEFVE